MSNQWFRSWHGAPTDPKWLGIARRSGVAPGMVAAVVWCLMDRASQATERGSIDGYDADGIGCFFGLETEQVEAIISALHEKGVLAGNRFASWENRQPKREDGASERAKEWRERKRTQPNAAEREQTLDKEKDTDTEERESSAPAKETQVQEKDPAHWQPVQDILKDRKDEVDDWELDFLHSIKWKRSLTQPQKDSLKSIQDKLSSKPKTHALPSVRRGTPAYEAWIAYYRRTKGSAAFYERLDVLTVPTEYPQEVAA
jgi:hypothetical protein